MNKKLKYIIITILVYFFVCVVISVYLTNKTRNLIDDAYTNRGVYRNDLEKIILQEDYEQVAGYGSGLNKECVDDTYKWSYKTDYVVTISFLFVSYTYVGDSCQITKGFEEYSGYNRSLRITWKIDNLDFEVDDVYEYIQPGLFQIVMRKLSSM